MRKILIILYVLVCILLTFANKCLTMEGKVEGKIEIEKELIKQNE